MYKQFLYLLTFCFVLKLGFSQTPVTIPSLTIGTQIWSTTNLNVSKFRNGEDIPQSKTVAEWIAAGNNQQPAWCYYNNDPANETKYGKLYNWYAVNDPRGLAPSGWLVPNEGDWNKLVKYLDASADTICRDCSPSKIAGGMMKSTSLWNYPNIGASNSSGFSANPAGFRTLNGEFMWIGNYGYWWSSDNINDIRAWYTHLVYDNSSLIKYFPIEKKFGFSVRLIRVESPTNQQESQPQIEGERKEYFRNGKLKKISNYKNGNLDGEWKQYDVYGQLAQICFYKNGNLEGERKDYYSNGQLMSISNYKNGKQVGEYKDFFDNGQLAKICYYINGGLEGASRSYNPIGQVTSITYYKNGVIDGACENYQNGQLKEIVYYKDGKRVNKIEKKINNNENFENNLDVENLLKGIFFYIGFAAKNPNSNTSSNSSKPQNNNSKNISSSNSNTGKNDKHSYRVLITWDNPNCGDCPNPKPSAQNGIVDYFYERSGSYRVIPVCPICGKKQYNTISGFTSNIGTRAQGSKEEVINCN